MVGFCAAWLLAVSMKDRFQRAHAVIMLLIVIAIVPSAARADTTRAQSLMGTVCEITVPDDDAKYIDLAFEEAKRLDALIDTWHDDSELSRVNAGGQNVSGELGAFLSSTIVWAQKTGGSFNPLVRPLIDAWKTRDGGAVPSKEAIAAAMKRVDLANVDVASGKVTVKNGAMFDEGGWGKGLAIDRMLGVFKQKGTKRVRINFGGQIGQYGDQPFVTIANPLKRDAPAVGYVRPHDLEVVRHKNGGTSIPATVRHVSAVGPAWITIALLFSSSMFAADTPPTSQPAFANVSHGAGVVC